MKARAALMSLDGVQNVLLSGMRATVVMEKGKKLDEPKVRDALGAKKLKFVSMAVVGRPSPKVMYNLKAKGVT